MEKMCSLTDDERMEIVYGIRKNYRLFKEGWMISELQRQGRNPVVKEWQSISILKRRKIGERLNKVIDIHEKCNYNDE